MERFIVIKYDPEVFAEEMGGAGTLEEYLINEFDNAGITTRIFESTMLDWATEVAASWPTIRETMTEGETT